MAIVHPVRSAGTVLEVAEPVGTYATLARHLRALKARRGRLVLMEGEHGVGKTEILDALAADARSQGIAVLLCASPPPSGDTSPLALWSSILAHVRGDSAAAGGQHLYDAQEADRGHDIRAEILGFFLDRRARAAPHLLIFDNLQWADVGSLDLLQALARQRLFERLPLLIVAAYRPSGVGAHLAAVRTSLIADADAAMLAVARLSGDDLRWIVRHRYAKRLKAEDEDRLVRILRAYGQGTPAMGVREMLRVLEEIGGVGDDTGFVLPDLSGNLLPATLRRIVIQRIESLDRASRRLLWVAATIGDTIPAAVWQRAASVSEREIAAARHAAETANLLEAAPDNAEVAFLDPSFRDIVRDHRASKTTPNDSQMRAIIGRLMETEPREGLVWLEGERNFAAVLRWLQDDQTYASVLRAIDGIVRGAEERVWWLLRFSRLLRVAHPLRAVDFARAAVAAAEDLGDPAVAAWARRDLGLVECFLGEIDRGIGDMRRGIERLMHLGDGEWRDLDARLGVLGTSIDARSARGILAMWLPFIGHYDEAYHIGRTIIRAEKLEDLSAVSQSGRSPSAFGDLFFGLTTVYAAIGRPLEAWEAYQRARAWYKAAARPLNVAYSAMNALYSVAVPYFADDPAECERVADEAERAFAQADREADCAATVLERAVRTDRALPTRFAHLPLLFVRGEWDELRSLARATPPPSIRLWHTLALSLLSQLAYEQGDIGAVKAAIADYFPDGPDTEPGAAVFPTALAMLRLAAAVAIDARDYRGAQAWLAAHERWLAWGDGVSGRAEGHLAWASYHQASGRLELSLERAERALACATQPRQPLALIAAHRMIGDLCVALRRHEDAAAHLDVAHTLARRCRAAYEEALTTLALAALDDARGESDMAQSRLDAARDTFAALGARRPLVQVQDLAVRINPAAALTRREIEILRHMAAGATNQEIADRLDVTLFTVKNHVHKILEKTGTKTRTGAAAWARMRHLIDEKHSP